MRVKFWGVRGSVPCPGPDTVKYGGNTPCVELRFTDLERLIIIDAGTGIRELGNALVSDDSAGSRLSAEIFLTHTHWDHIQGFPFFAPIYHPGTTLKIYGPATHEDRSLENAISGQLTYRYFPIRGAELASRIEYISLTEGRFDLGDGITLKTKYLNHPLLCLGYRFEYGGRVLCTAYDTEPYQNLFCQKPGDPHYDRAASAEGKRTAREGNRQLYDFYKDADMLIHDAQYTQAEYDAHRIGWGHSSYESALSAAKKSGVRRLALFHHEPCRTDSQLDALALTYGQPADMDIYFAREGMQVDL